MDDRLCRDVSFCTRRLLIHINSVERKKTLRQKNVSSPQADHASNVLEPFVVLVSSNAC